MIQIPHKPIHTIEDAMQLLDLTFPAKVEWESFYAEGKRKPPFLKNIPDENLVRYFREDQVKVGNAIDLGCGIGRNAIFLAKSGCQVDAVDLSPTAIAKANTLAQEEGVAVNFKAGSIFEVPFPANYYDLANDSGLLHHLQPHRRPYYLDLVGKLLKPTGTFTMTCFDADAAPPIADWTVYEEEKMPPGIGYSAERLQAILEPYFEIIELQTMQIQSEDTGLFGLDGMWTLLMKPVRS